MKRSFALGGVALCLVLAACADEAQTDAETAEAPAEATATQTPAPEPTGTDNPAPDETVTETESGIASSYTRYNLEKCETLASQEEEGESLEAKCAGFKGVPLFVNVGDGRFDISVGAPNDFVTISPFNELAETIEWRTNDGEPFAVIARLTDVSMESGGNSALIVETVGTAGRPGCRVAHVWNSTGSTQNQRAREIADGTAAAGFTCPSEPQRIR